MKTSPSTTKSTTTARTPPVPKAARGATAGSPAQPRAADRDAIAVLRADHRKVATLFADYEKADSAKARKAIVSEICTELTVHTQIEEEIFYPAFRAVSKDKLLVPEATVEHTTIKDLIALVDGVEPDGELYNARVMVMGEYVTHHVKEEQNEMFPKARASSMDMMEVGDRMVARKAELLAARG